MKPVKIIFTVSIFCLLYSFTHRSNHVFIGTYGVSATDPSQIKLTINADQSFYYQDFSRTDNKIVATGRWKLQGEKLILQSSDANIRFHNVWTFEKDGQAAKSHKGLLFYRLCKLAE